MQRLVNLHLNKANMAAPLTSIRLSGDDIEIVNQLLLPHVVEFIPITSIDEAHDAIKSMKVRFSVYFIRYSASD